MEVGLSVSITVYTCLGHFKDAIFMHGDVARKEPLYLPVWMKLTRMIQLKRGDRTECMVRCLRLRSDNFHGTVQRHNLNVSRTVVPNRARI